MKVVLRDVIDSDLPIFFEHQRDLVAVRTAAFPSRDHEAFMTHWAELRRNPSNLIRTIVGDGQVAGNIGSWIAEDGRLIGYWIGRVLGPGRGDSCTRRLRRRTQRAATPCLRGQAQRRLDPGSGEMPIRPVPRARPHHRGRRRGPRGSLHALAPRIMIAWPHIAHARDAGLRPVVQSSIVCPGQ
jgi:hypothetical protein